MRRDNNCCIWAILAMFSQDTIIHDLAGHLIHRLQNTISLHSMLHTFDELLLWLKPVDRLPSASVNKVYHTYTVCVQLGRT